MKVPTRSTGILGPAELRFDRYVDHQEAYGDVSSYAEYCLAEQAQQSGVKVLLNGLGGDEVFVGYPSFFGPLRFGLPQLVARLSVDGWPSLACCHLIPRS
jgi:asparagine synthetase B (glutamine-hydrolysing)